MAEYLSLDDAAKLIQDESTLALGGMTLYRRPVAFVKALLRRESSRPRSLTLLSFTCGYESDLLVGAGCVAKVRTVYFGLEAFGLAPMFTASQIEIIEESEASIVSGLRAQIGGVGFMPSQAWIGTDLPSLRPDVKTVVDPYSGETLMAFPAIPVDVAVIHGLEADMQGNVKINNNLGIDLELVFAAKTVIATVERQVERVEKSTDGLIIPAPGVDVISVVPYGAAPTSCYPEYSIKGSALMAYVEACNAGEECVLINLYATLYRVQGGFYLPLWFGVSLFHPKGVWFYAISPCVVFNCFTAVEWLFNSSG
jgi:glutaconate CoA-transferase subunit A